MEPYFSVESIQQTDGKSLAHIRLNDAHLVYKGHFPDVPVTPGVVLTDICRLLAQQICGIELQLKEAKSIKFLAMVNPKITPELLVSIDLTETENGLAGQFTGSFDERVYFKIHGRFSKCL
jgi:3-hydroxyacyl-[acyl-carrier-protein] dehydratase